MKLTKARLKQIIKEEIMREGDVVDLFPYKVMTNASGEPAKFKNLEAAIATAKAWDADGILMPEGTSDEVLDVVYHGEPLDPIAQRYDDEETAIKRAGPSPQPTDKEHADYMSLYGPEDY